MRIRHEVAALADLRQPTSGATADIHRHTFPDHAIVADQKAPLGEIIVANLSVTAKGGQRIDDRARADFRVAGDRQMRVQPYAVTEYDMRSDYAERSNFDAIAKARAILNDRARGNCHFRWCRPVENRPESLR